MTKLEDLKYFLYDLKLLLPKTLYTHTMIGTLEQKLDRLEKLEKENQELNEMYDGSIKEGHRLLKAKQKLEDRLEQLEKVNTDLCHEIEMLKYENGCLKELLEDEN